MSESIPRIPIQPTTLHSFAKQKVGKTKTPNLSFSKHLDLAKTNESTLKISKHASFRMSERNITIAPHVWNEIEMKINEAKQKGVNDSLVLLSNAAMIVSAKNNTVVTVVNRQEAESQIFTNIDGTIVMDSY